jgi:hypothetical protein
MGAKRIAVDPKTQQHARYLYEYTNAPVTDIAELLRMSRGTAFLRIKEWGWARRLQVAPRMPRRPTPALAASESAPQADPAANAQGQTPAEAAEATSTVAQLARTVERELEAIDKVLAGAAAGRRAPGASRTGRAHAREPDAHAQ